MNRSIGRGSGLNLLVEGAPGCLEYHATTDLDGVVGEAFGLFAATNIDGFVIIVLLFGQAVGRNSVVRVIVGTYLGFAAILAISILGALGARLLPESAIPYFGLLPLTLGLFIAWSAWREHRTHPPPDTTPAEDGRGAARSPDSGHAATGPGVFVVAAVTLSDGADNISAYIPVFSTAGVGEVLIYVVVFLVLVAVWCAIGHFLARRHLVAGALSRWGHIVLPVVLIGVGLIILIDGHAFGL